MLRVPDPIITVQVRGMMTRTEVYKLLILQLRNIHEKIGALCTGTDSLIHVLQISYFPTEVIERSTKKRALNQNTTTCITTSRLQENL